MPGGATTSNAGPPGRSISRDDDQTHGDLIIDNMNQLSPVSTPLQTSLDTLRSLTLRNGGRLEVANADVASFSLEQPLELTGNAGLTLGNGVTMSIPDGDLDVEFGSTLALEAGAEISAGTLSLNLLSGSTFSFPAGALINATIPLAYVQGGSHLTLEPGATWTAGQLHIDGSTVDSHVNLTYLVGGDFLLYGGGTINLLSDSTLSLPYFDETNIQSGMVNLTSDSAVSVASSAMTVGDGVTLIKDGVFGEPDAIGTLTVRSGGWVTHSVRSLEGLSLDVSGALTVESGGLIDVSERGLRGGGIDSAFGESGETFGAGDTIVPGAGGGTGAGASYGGRGPDTDNAVSNAPYGELESPQHLGSGGGGSNDNSPRGGHGGGRIKIEAGSCDVSGSIRANGGKAFTSGSGGGSGGAIWLEITGELSGSGTIETMGGRAGSNGFPRSSAGGGRIAMYYGTLSLPEENIHARGGDYDQRGSPGTIYLKDDDQTHGDLIIDNMNQISVVNTPLRTLLNTFRSLTIRNGGRLGVASADVGSFSLEQPLELTGNSALILGNGVTMSVPDGDLDVEFGSRLVLEAGAEISAGTLSLNLLGGSVFSYPAGALINATIPLAYVQGGSHLTLEPGATWTAGQLHIDGSTVDSHVNLIYPVGGDFLLYGDGAVNLLSNSTLSLPYFDETNIQSGTVYLPSGSMVSVASDAVTVGDGVTLIKDGVFDEPDQIGALTVRSGGWVTHSVRSLEGLYLDVGGALTVESGGLIDVSERGLRGGGVESAFGWNGETFGVGDTIVSGAGGGTGAGAGYGGRGPDTDNAVSNAPYGELESPQHLGSGGGGSGATTPRGGHGGGRIRIAAGSCDVSGSIRANGGKAFTSSSGGGSGGAIWLEVTGELSGSGTIEVMGGRAGSNGWPKSSAGGGRIAIYYGTLSLPEGNLHARGGDYEQRGSPGTVYLKDDDQTHGDLIIDNMNQISPVSTPLRTSLDTFRSLTLRNGGRLEVASADVASFSLEQPLELTGNAGLTLGNGVTMSVPDGDLDVEFGSTLALEAGAAISAGTLSLNLLGGSVFSYPAGALINATIPLAYVQGGSHLTLESGATWTAGQLHIDGSTVDSHVALTYLVGGDFLLYGGGTLNLLSNSTLSLPYFDETNIQSGTVYLPSGSMVSVASDAVTVGDGVTLIKDGVFGEPDEIGTLTVSSGGWVTHSVRSLEGLYLDVGGALTVESGGLIGVSERGLRGGGVESAFGWNGETFGVGDTIVSGAGGDTSRCELRRSRARYTRCDKQRAVWRAGESAASWFGRRWFGCHHSPRRSRRGPDRDRGGQL